MLDLSREIAELVAELKAHMQANSEPEEPLRLIAEFFGNAPAILTWPCTSVVLPLPFLIGLKAFLILCLSAAKIKRMTQLRNGEGANGPLLVLSVY